MRVIDPDIAFKNLVFIDINVASACRNLGEWPCMCIVRICVWLEDYYLVEKFGSN